MRQKRLRLRFLTRSILYGAVLRNIQCSMRKLYAQKYYLALIAVMFVTEAQR